jgi:hypothetical protein
MILYRLLGKFRWSTCETLSSNTCIIKLYVKQLEPRFYFDAKKNQFHPFHTNMKHAKPSETLPWFHGHLVKHIPTYNPKILKLLDNTFDAKKVKYLPYFLTSINHAQPIERLEWLHDELSKHIPIGHVLLNFFVKQLEPRSKQPTSISN